MNSAARVLMSLVATSAVACSSPVGADTSDQSQICREAYGSILPARDISEKDIGRLVSATYRMTEFSRPDGKTAIAVTDLSAEVSYGEETQRFQRPLSYFESKACWQENRWSGTFECYDTNRGPEQPANTIPDPHTRAFLSVAAYLSTGGQSDDFAKRIANGSAFSISVDGLYEKTSAPNHIDRWYICQGCGQDGSIINAPVALSNMRFGRISDATFFITDTGIVAKLGDGRGQASYARCQ